MKVAYNGETYDVGLVSVRNDASSVVHIPWQVLTYVTDSTDGAPSTATNYSLPLDIFAFTPEISDRVYVYWYRILSETETLYLCAGTVQSIDAGASQASVLFQHVTPVSGVTSDTVDAISAITQEEYAALQTKNDRIVYIIKG